MKKHLIAMMLVLMMLAVLVFVTACGGSDTTTEAPAGMSTQPVQSTEAPTTDKQPDENVTYTVIVKDQNGNAVEGVEVQICEGGTCKKPRATDAEGKVSFTFKPNGGVLEVQINGENSVSGYDYPPEKIAVPEGETTINVTIKARTEISVSASGLFGEKYADMTVTLYDAKTDTVVEQKITGENGLVSFTAPDGYYYVTITHRYHNPAFVFTNADEEGGNRKTIEKGQPRFEATIVVSPAEIEYEVTVKDARDASVTVSGQTVVLYDKNGHYVTEAVTGADGVAKFWAVNGSYYAAIKDSLRAFDVLVFTENREVKGEIRLQNMEAGADKLTALAVFDSTSREVMSNMSMWFTLVNGYKKQVVIESDTLKVTYNGKTYTPENGVITVTFIEKDGEAAFFTVETTKTSGKDSFSLTVSTPGSMETPIQLDASKVNGQKLSLSLSANEVIYYSFVATEDGTVSVQTTGTSAFVFINDRQNKAVVKKGDTVTISFASYDESGSAPATSYEATLSYGKVYVDYTVKTVIDGEGVSGVKVTLYLWNGEAFVEVTSATSAADGTVVFKNQLEASDYYVKAVYDKFETFEEYVSLEETSLELYLYHEEDGSYEYPISVGTNMNGDFVEVAVTVPASGSVWYSILVPSGVKLNLNNKDLTVKIYLDTNGNWIPDKEDTPVTLTWDVGAGAYVYEFKSSGVNREQCLIEISGKAGATADMNFVSSASSEEGSTLANAITVSEAGDLDVTLAGGKEVFYVFSADKAGTLKLTLKTNGAALKIWKPDLSGATSEFVTGTHSEKVIDGSWVYFSLEGLDGTFTVSVEFIAD